MQLQKQAAGIAQDGAKLVATPKRRRRRCAVLARRLRRGVSCHHVAGSVGVSAIGSEGRERSAIDIIVIDKDDGAKKLWLPPCAGTDKTKIAGVDWQV